MNANYSRQGVDILEVIISHAGSHKADVNPERSGSVSVSNKLVDHPAGVGVKLSGTLKKGTSSHIGLPNSGDCQKCTLFNSNTITV